MSLSGKITGDKFDELISCSRYSPKSIDILRQIFIEDKDLHDLASEFKITTNHARVLKARFLKKIKADCLNEFKQSVKPQSDTLSIGDNEKEITSLIDAGYSDSQIWGFMKKTGFSISLADLKKYIKSIKRGK